MSEVAQQRMELVVPGEHPREVAANSVRKAPAREEAMMPLASEPELAAIAFALAGSDAPVTAAEPAIVSGDPAPDPGHLKQIRQAIDRGDDPLGSAFCRLRSPQVRRKQGAIYTPQPIVDAMVAWAAGEEAPVRVVDPGAGSGRFLLAAGRVFPGAELVAVEIDPLAALMLRANAATLNMADRLTVRVEDFRAVVLPPADGPTLFLGNPPYVRHHEISADWKRWMTSAASASGFKASKLAGLHIHFFLKTRELARAVRSTRRLRRLRHVGGVARRELRRRLAQTAHQRPRRHFRACHRSPSDAVRGCGDDRGDHLFPRGRSGQTAPTSFRREPGSFG